MSDLEHQRPELFRRRRFEAPHRRRHPLRRLFRPFAASLAVVGIPAVVTWWVATSPQFEVHEIDVAGTPRVTAEWAGERLDALRGRHLLTVRLTEIERRLAEHPWIADLVVRRELPGRLVVRVVERLPAALWREAGELVFVDGSGRRIAPVDGDGAAAGAGVGGPLDLVVISSAVPDTDPASAAAAIRVAARWESLRPGDRVSGIEILRSGDFRLATRSLPFAVVVSTDRLDAAPAVLSRVWPLIESRRPPMPAELASVDLRFSRQIVFQPAAEPPREEG